MAEWELEQAAALGWMEITVRKHMTGRPSSLAKLKEVSETPPAKHLPFRRVIGKMISFRHHNFAMHAVYLSVKRGSRSFFYTQPLTDAYLAAFPHAKKTKRHAVASSMSRLSLIIHRSSPGLWSRGLPRLFLKCHLQSGGERIRAAGRAAWGHSLCPVLDAILKWGMAGEGQAS